jgi:hypothetical protein
MALFRLWRFAIGICGFLALTNRVYFRDLEQLTTVPTQFTTISTLDFVCPQGTSLLLPHTQIEWNQYKTIFLYHSRKAGGSTLRRLLQQVAQKHNVSFITKEGVVLEEEDMHQNQTLFVTSLRDPIDRIISSYWFEGRWPMKFPEENKTLATALSFDEWFDVCQNKTKKWQWFSVSNSYVKWFGTTGTTDDNDIVYDIDTAKQRLSKFHMVLRTEKMSDVKYWDRVTWILDAEDIMTKTNQRHANKGKLRPDNATSMDFISTEDMKRLANVNQLDYKLMECFFGS